MKATLTFKTPTGKTWSVENKSFKNDKKLRQFISYIKCTKNHECVYQQIDYEIEYNNSEDKFWNDLSSHHERFSGD